PPPPPAAATPAFREALFRRTSRVLRLRRWLTSAGLIAVLGVVYLAGLLTPHPAAPPAPSLPPAPAPADVTPAPPSEETAESAVALEYRALESERCRAGLYVRAADRYLLEDDLASAAPCSRLALDEGADATPRPDDTWLLLAIKNARKKEKTNATAHP